MLYIIRRKIMCNGKSMKMSGKVRDSTRHASYPGNILIRCAGWYFCNT